MPGSPSRCANSWFAVTNSYNKKRVEAVIKLKEDLRRMHTLSVLSAEFVDSFEILPRSFGS